MKYIQECQSHLRPFLWHFARIYVYSYVIREIKLSQSLGLEEKGNIALENPLSLTDFKGENHFVLVTKIDNGTRGSVYYLDSEILTNLQAKLLKGDLVQPKRVHVLPTGVLPNYSLIIADGKADGGDSGGLTLVHSASLESTLFSTVTDMSETTARYEYFNPAWIDQGICVLCRTNSDKPTESELVYFENVKTNLWRGRVLMPMACTNIQVFKNILGNLNALFVIDDLKTLKVVWDAKKDPKWNSEVKNDSIADDAPVMDFVFVDANLDGKMDMLVSVASYEGEVRAYQVPVGSLHFRSFQGYTFYSIIRYFKKKEGYDLCPGTIKTFLPTSEYKGKPWLLVSGGDCHKVIYVVPRSNDPKDWSYDKYIVIEDSGPIGGIEATDIDGNGFTDVFVSLHEKGMIKAYTFGESATNELDYFVIGSDEEAYGDKDGGGKGKDDDDDDDGDLPTVRRSVSLRSPSVNYVTFVTSLVGSFITGGDRVV